MFTVWSACFSSTVTLVRWRVTCWKWSWTRLWITHQHWHLICIVWKGRNISRRKGPWASLRGSSLLRALFWKLFSDLLLDRRPIFWQLCPSESKQRKWSWTSGHSTFREQSWFHLVLLLILAYKSLKECCGRKCFLLNLADQVQKYLVTGSFWIKTSSCTVILLEIRKSLIPPSRNPYLAHNLQQDWVRRDILELQTKPFNQGQGLQWTWRGRAKFSKYLCKCNYARKRTMEWGATTWSIADNHRWIL